MNTRTYVGMPLSEAVNKAEISGLKVNVSSEGLQPLNNDFVQSRLNLTVVNGIVTSATFG